MTATRIVSLIVSCALAALGVGCATGNDPCAPNPCTNPPADTCNGGVAQLYPATGQCNAVADLAECVYAPAETDCVASGLYCHQGQCLADPCDPNPCTSPPADTCDNNVVVSFNATGSCEVEEGTVNCSYSEAGRLDCADTGQACEGGVCFNSTDPCNPNPCTEAPADFCTDEVASIYASEGTCVDNAGTADCTYTPAELDCAANALVCEQGACVAPPDPCAPNPCTNPPADTCTNDTAHVYPSTGDCVDDGGVASCTYTAALVNCASSGLVCDQGLCVNPADPCNPNPCTNPPADGCSLNVAQDYSSPGVCTDLGGGQAQCDYPPVTQDCSLTGEVCSGGSCVPAATSPLLISEYVEGSSYNKYLEIYNAGGSGVDLGNYAVELYSNGSLTVSTTLNLSSVILQPGDVYVIADDGHTLWTTPGPDQVFAASLWNGNDAIRLVAVGQGPVDIVGVIGDAAYFGQDTTLVRNASVTVGRTGTSWEPTEWTTYAQDDVSHLGSHP